MARVARLVEERKKAKWIKAKKDKPHVHSAGRGEVRHGDHVTQTADLHIEHHKQTEVVFKVVHWHKSRRSAGDTASYIGRTRDCDKDVPAEQIYNEVGKALNPDEVQAELDTWSLTADRDNLSKRARETNVYDRFNLKEGERFGKRQTMHAILSFPQDGQMTPEQVREVADKTFRETLGEAGHQYIYAVHDHGRPHVHLIVKVRSEASRRQLRLGVEDINKIRELAARNAKLLAKANYKATRREDRPETRRTVKEGGEPLRVKDDYRKAKGRQPVKSWLHEKTPVWADRHAAEYHQRTTRGAGTGQEIPSPYSARLPPLSVKANTNLSKHFSRYQDQKVAQAKFLEMVAEDKTYAFWTANNRPEVFGALREDDAKSVPALTPQSVHVARAWQKEALKRIKNASNQELQKNPERIKGRQQTVDVCMAHKKTKRAEKRRHRDEQILSRTAPEAGKGMENVEKQEGKARTSFVKRIMEAVGLGERGPATLEDNKPPKVQAEKKWTRTRATEKAVDQRMSELDTRQTGHGQEKGRGR